MQSPPPTNAAAATKTLTLGCTTQLSEKQMGLFRVVLHQAFDLLFLYTGKNAHINHVHPPRDINMRSPTPTDAAAVATRVILR